MAPLKMRPVPGNMPAWPASRLGLILLPVFAMAAVAAEETRPVPDPRLQGAVALMDAFAGRTGLIGTRSPRRYLWTDAFAVCNSLGLARTTGDEDDTRLALELVDQVHHVLGRHRDDDPRRGWISGLDDTEGERHPTRGGLRIGKPLPERGPEEPLDERGEWDRDGQYFHYLTKWMHALDQVARATREPGYHTWARELAQTAFAAFTVRPARERMAWKMSIDLTRAQVPSMGQHDPLDGYLTALQLEASARTLAGQNAAPDLAAATGGFAAMIERGNLTTTDPLGLGGLLVDAWRVQQLIGQGAPVDTSLLDRLLDAAATGLRYYSSSDELRQPARYRLAFRELGLAIGLHALERLQQDIEQHPTPARESARLRARLDELLLYLPLREAIEQFWRDPAHRQGDTWTEHRDINEVMLATSLAPDGYLMPGP